MQFIRNVYKITPIIKMAVSEFEYEFCIRGYHIYKALLLVNILYVKGRR